MLWNHHIERLLDLIERAVAALEKLAEAASNENRRG